ncbi:dihydrolipoyl dehydrogenase family protein [Rubinisphaera margarita]|uniref:dihydrolipoyl dehydrogenase family protein n=1 Tax=Rubinisphaera margarita TaxID=2909586 RepID=UPI001EE848F6|nr:NAD(P)/FAD-dependent oxidoreductase [Rubinisphaera margarita]MCG6155871.1 NAD(P)/FAD-dependent oxidoreductase [Rubinisphaera margarita]
MADRFDLVILGSGPAATRVATRCAKANWQLAVIDIRPIGGTCALRGCVPKKVLVRAAELVDRAQRMSGYGTNLKNTQIEWNDLIEFKRTFTDPVTPNKRESFDELGIEVIQGRPHFTSRTTLEVDGRTIEAEKILLATGAAPVSLPFDGAELMITSDDFLELDQLPERIVFVGGGYVSFEFAHVAARAGAKVTILERSQPLEKFDSELVDVLIERSRQVGIEVRKQTEVESINRKSNGGLIVTSSSDGGTSSIDADLVVHGAGRAPQVEGLGLENAGVRFSKKGVEVNEFLQSTSNEAVYAAGDVVATSLPPLTPVANYHGKTVAKNLLEGNVARTTDLSVPSAVYTIPALAAVGITSAEANQQGLDFEVRKGDWSQFSSMKKIRAGHAMYKILVDKNTDLILGAHLLGPEAFEVINIFTVAMAAGMTTKELKSVLFAFPSLTADVSSMV